jgi:hypothetical protein
MTQIVNLAIAQWIPETEKWVAQMPAAVPEWVETEEVIADLAKGSIVERDGEFYRAHVLADTGLVMPSGFVKTVQ